MARRKNLLEAFQRSQASGGSPAVAPGAPAEPALPLFEAAASAPRPGHGFSLPLALVALVLTFALGFVLGRTRGGEARAEEPVRPTSAPLNQPRAFQERKPVASPGSAPAAVPPAGSAGNSERIQDSALFDLANVYTVIVASYTKGKNDANKDLAWATYQHLKDEGLPVFPPVESGNLLVVLAGAAPTKAALEATETRVRALVRDGEKPYFDAYRVGIDKLIPRSKPAD